MIKIKLSAFTIKLEFYYLEKHLGQKAAYDVDVEINAEKRLKLPLVK